MFSRRTTTTFTTTALAAALAILAAGQNARAASLPISSCGQTVTQSAVLTKDLDCAGTPGIVVGASGITIDLKGHVLKGNGTKFGIDDEAGYDKVTIKNGVVRNFDTGLRVNNDGNDITLSNVISSGNKGTGVYVGGDSASIASTTSVGNGGSGIIVVGDSASVRSSSAVGNGGEGIWLEGATPSIKASSALGNSGNGLIAKGESARVTTATANGNGLLGVYVVGDLASITSSTASGNGDVGIKVFGDAAVVRRNRAEANGFLGGVSDGVGPGIWVENFTTPPEGTNVARGNDRSGDQCGPSALCPPVASTLKGAPITSCGQVASVNSVLVKDLTCPDTGILVGASGITIDLNGHVLKGNNSFAWGISNLSGFDDVTIENGVVRNFANGIVAWNSADGNTAANVVVSGNTNKGVEIVGASAKIIASTAARNGQAGIHVQGSSPSVTSSTVVGNGAEGIWLEGAAPTVKSSSAVANNPNGMLLEGDSASVMSSTASANALHGVLIAGAFAAVKSITASGNTSHGIDAWGDAATLKGNKADGNGLPGGVSDGWGLGIFAGNFTTAPIGTNVARGNDDSLGCNPSALC